MNALMHPSTNVRRVESRIGDFFGKGSKYLSKSDVSVDRDDSSVPKANPKSKHEPRPHDPPRKDGRGALHVQARDMKFNAAAGTPVMGRAKCVGRCELVDVLQSAASISL